MGLSGEFLYLENKSTKTILEHCFSCQNKSVCPKLARFWWSIYALVKTHLLEKLVPIDSLENGNAKLIPQIAMGLGVCYSPQCKRSQTMMHVHVYHRLLSFSPPVTFSYSTCRYRLAVNHLPSHVDKSIVTKQYFAQNKIILTNTTGPRYMLKRTFEQDSEQQQL